MIKSDVLKNLVKEFSKPREEFGGKSYITRRRDWFDKPMQNIRPLILKENLDKLTFQDAQRIYNQMSVGGPKLYPKTYAENGLDKIKASLQYLLYGDDPLPERFYNFANNPESEYRLNGVGRAFASTALFLIDHKEYGIWNAAVDGGLKKLGMLPKRKRGEQTGQTYIKIIEVLKQLQNKCGFEDLSIVDEFVELIYHQQIGANILIEDSIQLEEVSEQEEIVETAPGLENLHLQNQYMLVKIGRMRGYDIWVASNDRNKTIQGERLSDLSLKELPQFSGPNVLKIAKSIDVIWFKKNTAQPIYFFEIEHSTSIYSGLLRLNDVKIDYPIPQAFIVAPKDRKRIFESQLERRTFAYSELSDICQFLSYEDIKELFTYQLKIKTIFP